jgi:hypothetical protein
VICNCIYSTVHNRGVKDSKDDSIMPKLLTKIFNLKEKLVT